jgi:hypothetical protein
MLKKSKQKFKNNNLGFGFNKKTFELEQQLHKKQSTLQIIKLKSLFIKKF